MPRIRMKVTAQGSSDGFSVGVYRQGEEYDVSPRLAQNFVIQQGIAEPVRRRRAVETSPENKMVADSPDNKDAKKEMFARVFQLADELGVASDEIIRAAKECGIVAATPISGLSGEDVKKIKAKMK